MRTLEEEKILRCSSDRWVHLGCDDHPERTHIFQIKHKISELSDIVCEYCHDLRRRTIIAKSMHRYKQVTRTRDKLTLWTLGTSLTDSEESRKTIQEYWKKFGSQMRVKKIRKQTNYDPMMNCLEKGTTGGKLHYHFVARSYMKHELILDTWRKITGEKSNVNFQLKKTAYARTAIKIFGYLAKYISKDGLRYYFMGDMLTNAKNEEYTPQSTCIKWLLASYDSGYLQQFQMTVSDFKYS